MFYGMNAWFLATLVLGALLWVAVASVPAWRRLEAREGAQAYVSTWSRGGPALALMTVVAIALAGAASFDDADRRWAIGAVFLALALGFTFAAMAAPGHRLRDVAEGKAATNEVPGLLRTWAGRHWIRTALY
ncbi:MAG: anthrone oxygenase family protein, partial [Pseudomonadota bacterium]